MKNAMHHHRPIPEIQWLALGAVVGPSIFLFAAAVFGLLRPDYSFVSEPISALAVGSNGEFMRAAFLLNGLLTIIGIMASFQGLRTQMSVTARWVCTTLLALSPFGLLWAGVFSIDHPTVNLVGALLAFSAPIITFLIVGFMLRRTRWKRFGTFMLWGSLLTLALLIGFMTSVNSVPPSELEAGRGGGNLGLWQRALIGEIQAWFIAIGWKAFRRS